MLREGAMNEILAAGRRNRAVKAGARIGMDQADKSAERCAERFAKTALNPTGILTAYTAVYFPRASRTSSVESTP